MPQDIVGKTLAQVNEALLNEAVNGLRVGNMSAAAHLLTTAAAKALASKLQIAVVESKCGCGQPDCETYRFAVPKKGREVRYLVVRLYVRGELLLHIDSDCDVYKIERLYDLAPGERTVYARDDDSWRIVGRV